MMALASPAPCVVVEMWLRERRLLVQQLTYLCGHMARVVVGEGESEGEGGGEGGGVGGCAWEREIDGDWEAVDPTERLARHDKGDGIRAVVGGQDGAADDDDDTNSADSTSACSSAPSAATGRRLTSLVGDGGGSTSSSSSSSSPYILSSSTALVAEAALPQPANYDGGTVGLSYWYYREPELYADDA